MNRPVYPERDGFYLDSSGYIFTLEDCTDFDYRSEQAQGQTFYTREEAAYEVERRTAKAWLVERVAKMNASNEVDIHPYEMFYITNEDRVSAIPCSNPAGVLDLQITCNIKVAREVFKEDGFKDNFKLYMGIK